MGTPFTDLPVLSGAEATDEVAAARGGATGRVSVAAIATQAAGLVTPGAAGSGMPVFAAASANIVYDASSNRVGGPLNNFTGSLPSPAMIAVIMPTDLDRKAEALTFRANATDGDLVSILGSPIAARLLTPGCAHIMIYAATIGGLRFTMLDHLNPRPQDFDIVVARTYPPYTQLQADADAAAGMAFSTGEITVPPRRASDPGTGPDRNRNSLLFGVPRDAPDISNVVPRVPLGITTYSVAGPISFVTTDVGGVPHKWFSGASWVADAVMDVHFAPYPSP